jgi:hypothetical protein
MLTAASSGTTTPHLNSGKPPPLEPNIGAISSHLYNLFSPEFVQGYPDSWIEIAYCRPDAGLNKARNFSAFDIGGAADFAASMNRHGYNIYIGPGLRHGDKPETGRASAHHFLASRYFWAEFDGEGDDDRIAAICQEMELKPALAVTTGTTPFPRRHLYFEAAEPVTTAAEIQAGNIALKDLFGSDDVDDPSRVMRLAGTVNHPSPKKTLKGYQPEVTALHAPASPPAYSVEALCDLRPAKEQPKDDKFSEEGEGELRGLAKVRGLLESSKGVRWHIPVRAATASLIGLGFPDDVIATICAPYCAGGYEDPDLAKFIQSARKKFGRERESGQQKRFPLIRSIRSRSTPRAIAIW